MTKLIRCADCGSSYETKRPNTKYCRVCRLSRNAEFYATRISKCWKCEQKFAPYDAKQVICGGCRRAAADGPRGICGLCKLDREHIHADIAVCHPCATDPSKRALLIRALAAKVARRTAEAVNG